MRKEDKRGTELTNSHDGDAMREGREKEVEERLEIEIYDIENEYDGDRARSRFAFSSLVAVNLAMRADQTKIGC